MTSVQSMWDLAKDLADTPGEFAIEDRGVDYANTALRVLHNALVSAQEDYFRSEQTINVVNGTETYALNADFMRAIKVFYEPTGGERRYPVERFHLADIAGYKKYAVNDGTLKLWYAPKPTVFTLPNEDLENIYPPGSEDFIAYHMAVQLSNREDDFEKAQSLRQERAMVLSTLVDALEPRDEEDDMVADYYNRWGGDRRIFASTENREYLYRILGTNIHIIQTDWRGL